MTWPAILPTCVGAIVAFFFGAAWYGGLSKAWMKAAKVTPEEAKMGPVLFVVTFLTALGISFGIGAVLATLGISNSIPSAMIVTAFIWLFLTLFPLNLNHRYQGASFALTLIDGFYWLAVFQIAALSHVLMGGAPKFLG